MNSISLRTCSNMMALPQPSRSMNMNLTTQKSQCLLCSLPVLIPKDDPNTAKDRDEMIKTLCYYVNMPSKKVPKTCTAEMFPFCGVCERLVKQIWENDKIVQEAQNNISKGIALIERTVVDADFLSRTRKSASSSTLMKDAETTCVKLRDTILDGYGTKVLIKQKLRNVGMEFGIETPRQLADSCSHMAVVENTSFSKPQQFHAKRGASSQATATSSSLRNQEFQENTTVNVTPSGISMKPTSSISDQGQEEDQIMIVARGPATTLEAGGGNNSHPPNITLREDSSQQQQPDKLQRQLQVARRSGKRPAASSSSATTSFASPARVIGMYNENSCTMVISNVRSDVSPSIPVVIKQEPIDLLSPVQGNAGKRRRRTLFQDVEICKLTDPRTNQMHLQCSICKFVLPITNCGTGPTPYQKMTQHITEKHLGKRRRAALMLAAAAAAPQRVTTIRKSQFVCKICRKVFQDRKSLMDHESSHATNGLDGLSYPAATSATPTSSRSAKPSKYYVQDLHCDICGRPIKGNYSNLLAHKFSHKNNEERLAAKAAKEKGCRQALLRSTPTKSVATTKALVQHRIKKSRARVKRRPFTTPAVRKTHKGKNPSDSYTCQICNRSFSRSCHLTLHMMGHARRNHLPIPLSVSKNRKPKNNLQKQDNLIETEKHLNSILNSGEQTQVYNQAESRSQEEVEDHAHAPGFYGDGFMEQTRLSDEDNEITNNPVEESNLNSVELTLGASAADGLSA